jgi:hypothetical protein
MLLIGVGVSIKESSGGDWKKQSIRLKPDDIRSHGLNQQIFHRRDFSHTIKLNAQSRLFQLIFLPLQPLNSRRKSRPKCQKQQYTYETHPYRKSNLVYA